MNRAAVTLLLLRSAAGSSLPMRAGLAHAEKIPQATDAPGPRSPETSRRWFRLPQGLRVDLVAAEPQLAEPSRRTRDHRGIL
jgi:hypothetical protein